MSPEILWNGMGFVSRTVMILLVLMSVLSLFVAIERSLLFRRARRQSLRFLVIAVDHLAHDRSQAAVEAAKRFPQSHLAKVVTAGLTSYHQKRHKARLSADALAEAARRAAERAMLSTAADLRRGLAGLATVATLAPFVGLFGTVAGIIKTFQIIGVEGTAGFDEVSVGISEALVATAIGIGVAIPAAWMYNYLVGKVERLQIEMANAASELDDFLAERQEGSA